MNTQHYAASLASLREAGNLRRLRPMTAQGFCALTGGESLINLSSNDYLGLSTNEELRREFLEQFPLTGSPLTAASSRLLSGNHEEYVRLEASLEELYQRPALVLASGYHANTGILPAITTKRDLIVADKLVHASTIDGFRLSDATLMRFRHRDYQHLERLLQEHRAEFDNVFIVTESIFSMDGDEADLPLLCQIKREHNAFLYVDEAHAVGVRGANGLGCAEECNCLADIDFLVGTFGKALASVGAFVICSDLFRQYLINTQRTLIFSTALPPINVAWSNFVLRKLPSLSHLRTNIHNKANALRAVLGEKAFATCGSSHIVPLICGENEKALATSELLRREGFLAMAVRHPTVPKGQARIRFSLNASMPDDLYNQLFNAIRRLP